MTIGSCSTSARDHDGHQGPNACAVVDSFRPGSETEEWRAVKGWPYEVSSLGRLRRAGTDLPLGGGVTRNGYPAATLHARDGASQKFTIHSLVAAAFIGPRPPGMHVNHKDGVKANNRSSNLEYVSPGDNVRHAVRIGLIPGPASQASARQLDALRVIHRRTVETGAPPTVREIAAELGISSTNAVSDHLHALERKGLLARRARGMARTIWITDSGLAALGVEAPTLVRPAPAAPRPHAAAPDAIGCAEDCGHPDCRRRAAEALSHTTTTHC